MDALMKIVDAVFRFVSLMPGSFWVAMLETLPGSTAVFYLRWWFGRPGRWKRAAMAGDAFAVCARRYLDPGSARDLLAAAEAACGPLGR